MNQIAFTRQIEKFKRFEIGSIPILSPNLINFRNFTSSRIFPPWRPVNTTCLRQRSHKS